MTSFFYAIVIEHYDHTGNVIQCSDGLCFAKLRIFSIFMTAVFVRQQIFRRKLRYKYKIYEGKKLKTHFQIVTIYIQHHIKPQIIYGCYAVTGYVMDRVGNIYIPCLYGVQ